MQQAKESAVETRKEEDAGKKLNRAQYYAVFVVLTVFSLSRGVSTRSHLRSSVHVEPQGESRILSRRVEESEDITSPFLLSKLEDDGKSINEIFQIVSLPPQLTAELEVFCRDSGLLNAFRSVSYTDNPSIEAVANQ